MIYETPQQHEARTMPDSMIQSHAGHKRHSEKPSWLLLRDSIESMQKEMGMQAFTRMIEEEQQRRDYWRQQDED